MITAPRPSPAAARDDGGVLRRRAVRWTAGAGVACIAVGMLLALAPGGPVDVGTVPSAAARVIPGPAPDAAVPAAPEPVLTPAARPAAAGTVPVAVTLPDRGVSAPVVPTATDADGGLVVPDPPTTVGWWSPGALAGAPTGTTVLAGHVDSVVAGLGAFAVLRQVGVGERVELRGADGRVLAYRVVARRQVVKTALPAELFNRDRPPRLVLITCGGRFDATVRHYTDNVIVYAEPG